MNCGPVDISYAQNSKDVGAILWCGYPGQSGGDAIADALFGTVNPSGKLTRTWYPQAFADKVSLSDYRMRPDVKSGYPGRTHRFFTGVALYPFGFGLSYTSMVYGPPTAGFAAAALQRVRQEALHGVTRTRSHVVGTARVTVTNAGPHDGAETVLLFAAPPLTEDERASAGAPLHTLVGFERVFLRVGQTTDVAIHIKAHALTFAGRDGQRVAARGNWVFWTGTATDKAHNGLPATLS